MPKVMNKNLQIAILKRIFKRLNPDVDESEIDWEAEVDETLSFDENRKALSRKYSQFKWYGGEEEHFTPEVLEEEKEYIRRQAEEYGIINEEIEKAIKERENEFLWDKFCAVLEVNGINPNEYESRFREEFNNTVGLPFEDRQMVIIGLAKDIIKERVEVKPKVTIQKEIQKTKKPEVGIPYEMFPFEPPYEYREFYDKWMSNFKSMK
jgi:hypothetical protein